jgi:hypothetical protein
LIRRSTATRLALLAALLVSACGPARSPSAANRSPVAQKWFDRLKSSYTSADIDDASDAARSAVKEAPGDAEVLTWAARVALARLDYDETVRLLKGLTGSEARGLRGRAKWYAGQVDAAADELEAMLTDPEVHDAWAKAISQLARRGTGRKPFTLSGGLVGMCEMPRVPGNSAMIVPLEIDGEESLAMIATGTAELTLDSTTRKEPSWVSLRFGGRLEVKDVPAIVQDLSGLSRQMNAPIKALLGVNLLRHLNATFDYVGGQFVARRVAAPPPPNATRITVYYAKGGGMFIRSAFGPEKSSVPAVLLLDTSMAFPLALDDEGWKKAGVPLAKLTPVQNDPKLRQGTVAVLRLGAFEIPDVPSVAGTPIAEIEKGVQINLDGVIGASLLGAFRITLGDEGRTMWVEDLAMPPPSPPAAEAPPAPALGAPSLALPAADAKTGAAKKASGKKPTPKKDAVPKK